MAAPQPTSSFSRTALASTTPPTPAPAAAPSSAPASDDEAASPPPNLAAAATAAAAARRADALRATAADAAGLAQRRLTSAAATQIAAATADVEVATHVNDAVAERYECMAADVAKWRELTEVGLTGLMGGDRQTRGKSSLFFFLQLTPDTRQATNAKRLALADALTAAVADLEPAVSALEADVAELDAASRALAARAGVADPPSQSPARQKGGGPLSLLRRWV